MNKDYTLESFYKYKCIFVHIPKCAGISVANTLFGNKAYGHLPIIGYQKIFTTQEFENFFKFTFVRNPWDRLVSAYHFLKNGGFDEIDRAWSKENLSKFDSFEEFVCDWISNDGNIWTYNHFIPQYHFILDANGDSLMDCIGDIENLEEDFKDISKILGINSTLQHLNVSKRGSYRKYYTPTSRKIVEEIYKHDIALFDYKF